MLELASLGAQVLNNRSVELAKKYGVELEVLSSINPVPGTVVKEETKVEGMLIKGVAKDEDVAVVSILEVPDVPGMSFKVFSLLAQKNINVDIILQSSGSAGCKDVIFTCSKAKLKPLVQCWNPTRPALALIRSPSTMTAPRSALSVPVCRATLARLPPCLKLSTARTSTSI